MLNADVKRLWESYNSKKSQLALRSISLLKLIYKILGCNISSSKIGQSIQEKCDSISFSKFFEESFSDSTSPYS